ncbi:hypothetical protein [Kitasatospora cineracea]
MPTLHQYASVSPERRRELRQAARLYAAAELEAALDATTRRSAP